MVITKEKAKVRPASLLMRRMEQMLPQRLIVRHGKASLKKHIRNIGTAAECTAGTPKTVKIGVNGVCPVVTAPLS